MLPVPFLLTRRTESVRSTRFQEGRRNRRSGSLVEKHFHEGSVEPRVPHLRIGRDDKGRWLEHCFDDHVDDRQDRRSYESGAKAGYLQAWGDFARQHEHERVDH